MGFVDTVRKGRLGLRFAVPDRFDATARHEALWKRDVERSARRGCPRAGNRSSSSHL
jgi:hypothetical protein